MSNKDKIDLEVIILFLRNYIELIRKMNELSPETAVDVDSLKEEIIKTVKLL